jgi:hypothetical protein
MLHAAMIVTISGKLYLTSRREGEADQQHGPHLAARIPIMTPMHQRGMISSVDSNNSAIPRKHLGSLTGMSLTQQAHTRLISRMALICWIALLVLTGLKFDRQRKQSRREPGFTPPESSGISYANVYTGNEVHDEERYNTEPKPLDEPQQMAYDPPTSYVYDHQPAQMPVMEHRASMDAYASAGDRTSRTMQIAYSDPCKLEFPLCGYIS